MEVGQKEMAAVEKLKTTINWKEVRAVLGADGF